MDLCGFPKAAFYMHQAAWIDNRPILSITPHWNWRGHEGQPIKVVVMSNVPDVELFLNGKSLGAKSLDRIMGGEWEVPYAPGKLEAVATKDGAEIARTAVETTGDPVALKLIPDRDSLAGDGADATPITVCALDDQGREVPTANLPVTFEISGPGAIIGLGNGDNTSHEPEKGNHRSLFNGLAQVIVQSQRDQAGTMTLTAVADGVKSAEVQLAVQAVAPLPAVPPADPVLSAAK
jgi:beta-galactosidase